VRLADAIQHPKWQEAMNEELMAIEKKNTGRSLIFQKETKQLM